MRVTVMQLRQVVYVSVAILAVVLATTSLHPITRAEADAGFGAPALSGTAVLSREAWLDVGVTEVVLLSEGMLVLLGVLGCGLAVAGLEAFDLWRERRAGKVAWLHTRIATALKRDRLLGELAVTPIVHLPLWERFGATVELCGQVPTLWLRHAVLRTVEQEAARNVAVYHIEDRITIVPSMEALAA